MIISPSMGTEEPIATEIHAKEARAAARRRPGNMTIKTEEARTTRVAQWICALIIGTVCLSGVSGQPAEPMTAFAVADVHPSADSSNPDTWGMSGGLMRGG